MGPRADFLRAGQADANGIKISDQTCAIIGAAAIQGCFLPAFVLRRKPRSGTLSNYRPAENPNKNFSKSFAMFHVRARRAVTLRDQFLIPCFFRPLLPL